MEERKATYPCDLHTHTNCSDGKKTPKEVIDEAAAAGLKVLAITDHDVAPPEVVEMDGKQVPIVEYAREKGVILLPGTEISCDTENEDVHLVCLGCDWRHPFFQQLEEEIRQSKVQAYRVMVDKFSEAGYHAGWEDMLERTGNRMLPERIQKKQIFQYLADLGVAPDWSQVKKMVQTTPELAVRRRKPNPVDMIAKIHETGGIVILAHPYLIAEPVWRAGHGMTREAYIGGLIDRGLDGIEVRYPYDKTSYRGSLTRDEIAEEVRRLYGNRVAVLSGGSDYHGESGGQVVNPRRLGEEGVEVSYVEGNPLLKRLAGAGFGYEVACD